MKNHTKIFWFIPFHTKLRWFLNLWVYSSTKIDLLEFMMEVDIQYSLKVKNMISFTPGLNIFLQ